MCVNPVWVEFCRSYFIGFSNLKICSVVGFPLGSNCSEIKAEEARCAIADGADEVDMVINIGALKSGNLRLLARDIQTVRRTTNAVLKVIIEACLLTHDEKVRACNIARAFGADFVKTSTGFSVHGATVEDVKLMRSVVGKKMGVKAAGGIKTLAQARAMLEAGANRLGCSASVQIVEEEIKENSL